MSTPAATIRWSRTGDGDFLKGQYGRARRLALIVHMIMSL
jgi:hypothetical protein